MAKKSDKYQGWSNKETWATNLWLSNTEEFYRDVELAKEEIISREKSKKEQLWKLSDYIERYVRDLKDEFYDKNNNDLSGMFNDIGSVWRVNFYEIAKSSLNK